MTTFTEQAEKDFDDDVTAGEKLQQPTRKWTSSIT